MNTNEHIGDHMTGPQILRHTLPEASQILRMSRTALYQRIARGELHAQHDGARRYISADELRKYVERLDGMKVAA